VEAGLVVPGVDDEDGCCHVLVGPDDLVNGIGRQALPDVDHETRDR
jgi:hypothetical protein